MLGRMAKKLGSGLGSRFCEEKLRELGWFSLKKRKLRRSFIMLYNCLKEGYSQVRIYLFSQATSNGTRGHSLKGVSGKV